MGDERVGVTGGGRRMQWPAPRFVLACMLRPAFPHFCIQPSHFTADNHTSQRNVGNVLGVETELQDAGVPCVWVDRRAQGAPACPRRPGMFVG